HRRYPCLPSQAQLGTGRPRIQRPTGHPTWLSSLRYGYGCTHHARLHSRLEVELESQPNHCGPVERFETPRLFSAFRTLNQTISPTTVTTPPSATNHVIICSIVPMASLESLPFRTCGRPWTMAR